MTESDALQIKNLVFRWNRAQPVLDIPSFNIPAGEKLFLQGASGSGKSTLLALIAGISVPSSGDLKVLGHDMGSMSEHARDAFRAERLGIIFQQFNLLPYLSLLDNVLLPCRFSPARGKKLGPSLSAWKDEARGLLSRLGLGELATSGRSVSKLSVGQQQRVAAARALIGSPDFVIADEPTSALDARTREGFIATLMAETERTGATLLFVSHDQALGQHFDRQVDLESINRTTMATEVMA